MSDDKADVDWAELAADLDMQLTAAQSMDKRIRRAIGLCRCVDMLASAARDLGTQTSPDPHTIGTIERIEEAAGRMASYALRILEDDA